MDFKKGDIVYTEEYSIGLFEVYAVEGDRIRTSPHGWAWFSFVTSIKIPTSATCIICMS